MVVAEGMRILVTLLLDTLPMLGNVLMLCFFVFFIFGIIGVQLWSGLLRNRCFLDLPANVSTAGYVYSCRLEALYRGGRGPSKMWSGNNPLKCKKILYFV